MSIEPLVRQVARGNPEITGAMLVDAGGTVEASKGLGTQLATAAVALVLPLRDFLDRAAAELGCGALSCSVVEGFDSLEVERVVGRLRRFMDTSAAASVGSSTATPANGNGTYA